MYIVLFSISGTHAYIDGTKNWKMMKKRLRFQMPHVPLKVLRGQQDEEDVQDENYTVPPGTSTEEEAERAASDNDSRTSHSSHDDITTDVDTTGSINQGAAGVQIVAQVHRLPSTDATSNDSVDLSNDDRAPLLPKEH